MAYDFNSLTNQGRIYQAYSGCDMIAHVNETLIGTLQAVTISVTREVVPVYSMGSADPKCFVKGKRGIAGTMSFSTFDRHALIHDAFQNSIGRGFDAGVKLIDLVKDAGQAGAYGQEWTNLAGDITNYQEPSGKSGLAQSLKNYVDSRKLRYSDEIPPFNITLTMVNEQGSASFFTIEGVVLVNEGYGFTMDDLTSEQAYTYVARRVNPLTSLNNFFYPRG